MRVKRERLTTDAWENFCHGLGIQNLRRRQETIGESILEVLRSLGIHSPEQVNKVLHLPAETFQTLLINAPLDQEQARQLGVYAKMFYDATHEVQQAAQSLSRSANVEWLFSEAIYDDSGFEGATIADAIHFILAQEKMTFEECAAALVAPQNHSKTLEERVDGLRGLIERAENNKKAAKLLGAGIHTMLSERAVEEEVEEPSPSTPHESLAGKDSETMLKNGPFAGWVQEKLKKWKQKVLANRWKDEKGKPLFTQDDILRMRDGRLVPTDAQLVCIVRSEKIEDLPTLEGLYYAVRGQMDLLEQAAMTVTNGDVPNHRVKLPALVVGVTAKAPSPTPARS